jgi:hypothetical protein
MPEQSPRSKGQVDTKPRPEKEGTELLSSRLSYAIVGALGGVALAVLALIQSNLDAGKTYPGARGALWLVVGALVGVIVGLELHSTRSWRQFGKYTFTIRFVLACSAGGTGLGLGGMLLGMVIANDLWKYTAGGAGLALLLLFWIKVESVKLW